MTTRVFVCHAKSDIEATSEIVDLLESTLELPSGSLSSSSLPGYSPDSRSDDELRQMLSQASVAFALLSQESVRDTTFTFELGAAWALGVRIVPLLLDEACDQRELPWPLRAAVSVHPDDREAWLGLVQELAAFLGVRVRVASEARMALDEVAARTSHPPSQRKAAETSDFVSIAPIEAAFAVAHGTRPLTCERAFEAGRAISDCMCNRNEGLDFARELEVPFGRFIDGLGGNWQDLRQLQDLDVWLGTTDNLLGALPEERRMLGQWYGLGYELAKLHYVASQEASTQEARDAAEAHFRQALERLLSLADALHIRYEEQSRVLALLENLMGPANERDFLNIGRSLEELRNQASRADQLTSAA